MRTIRLSELVHQGRLAMVADSEPERHLPSAVALTAAVLPAPQAAASRRRVPVDVIEKIEDLAVQLLSISKASKTDPDSVMRHALISIDQCISSLAARH